MGKSSGNGSDSGNGATPRRGLFARLFRRKAEDSDAFGQAPEAPADPFGLADEAQDARFQRRKRLMAVAMVLLLVGGGGGAAAYFWLRPADEEKPAAEAAPSAPETTPNRGRRVVRAMPPAPGPENLKNALMRPPGSVPADNPDVARRMGTLSAAPPGAPAAPEPTAPAQQTAAAEPQTPPDQAADKPAAPPPAQAAPPVAGEPEMPSPRADRNAPSKPPRLADLPKLPPPQQPLPKAPLAELQQRTPAGLVLPAVAADGRHAWQVYGRPFTAQARIPRIAVIVRVGLAAEPTRAAIDSMPPEVTLAFDVDAPQLRAGLAQARAAGHEALLELGMEAAAFPAVDPGPEGLLTALGEDKNRERLDRALARGDVYVGLLARDGERYAASPPHFAALMQDLSRMGIAYVASGRASPLETAKMRPAHATVDVAIPAGSFRERVAARIAHAETLARARGAAVIVADATPLNLSMLHAWFAAFPGKALQLAPLSAVVKAQ
ncbi:MAG: divergent polysaccharide deacetylase family protein [Rhodospirillaceae bacterium]